MTQTANDTERSHIPDGHQAVTPYLHLRGADTFIEFARAAFGAEVRMAHRDDGAIVHAEIAIEGCVLEISEAKPEWPAKASSFHVFVPDADAAFERALAAGATPLSKPSTHDYGERSGGVRDAWGNDWYLATVVDPVARAS